MTEHLALKTAEMTRGNDRLRVARTAAVVGCVYFFLHSIWVVLGPERRLMEWLYDDCFYYLITAKHLSEQHLASFDGITVTNGYHPLWMWVCTAIYAMRGQLDLTYVRFCMGLSICLTSMMLFVAFRHAARERSAGWFWAVALGATSYSALNNGLTVMEWPLVVLCWLLLHALMMSQEGRGDYGRLERRGFWAAFGVGLLGSFSRTDFGLIPAAYLIGGALVGVRYGRWGSAKWALFAFFGSAAGLGLVFIYHYRTTGGWLQRSMQVKETFASLSEPFSSVPPLWQFARVLVYLPALNFDPARKAWMLHAGGRVLAALFLACGVLVGIQYRRLRVFWHRMWGKSAAEDLALASALAGLAGYFLLYGLNSQATYGWYTGTVTGFVLVLAARFLGSVRRAAANAIGVSALLINVVASVHFGGNARNQWQENVVGKRMHRDHPDARMGGGDVGKPSFYNNGMMFNLDGLMNNEVYPYLIQGRIHCYILDRRIEYLSDIGTITEPLTDRERAMHHEAPLPWEKYFIPVAGGREEAGVSDAYLQADFDAIQRSGECNKERH